MFELFIAKGYLWPSKGRLSLSLIGVISLFLISLIVWLLMLFFSITEGIEKNWLTKLTSLNAPIRITPTDKYYNSYYYQIDSIASDSNYSYKTIGEKLISQATDPYNSNIDEELPFYWPKDNSNDFVKNAFLSINKLKSKWPSIVAQDYEIAAALVQLRMKQNNETNFLTQASYISSFTEKSGQLLKLLQPPNINDINNLLLTSSNISSITQNIKIEEASINSASWQIPNSILKNEKHLLAFTQIDGNEIPYLIVPVSENDFNDVDAGELRYTDSKIIFTINETDYIIDETTPLLIDRDVDCIIKNQKIDSLEISINLQNKIINTTISINDINLKKIEILQQFDKEPLIEPPWVYYIEGSCQLPENGIILPTSYKGSKVKIGDKGFFSFNGITITSTQEQRINVRVAGFYDPGLMAIGNRIIIADQSTVHQINSTTQNIALDSFLSNGICVWFDNINKTNLIAKDIEEELTANEINQYWKVTTFYDYEFAKDLMSQFKSDRYLFMLIGIIILIVACFNIISTLLMLVNDKKQEIGILLSLGAKKRSIGMIFGVCGLAMGIISCFVGGIASYITLLNIDSLVNLLNYIEGQQAFNSAFYGESLPKEFSKTALIFIITVTPLLSLIAGLFPAIKACKVKPSEILRSQ